MHPQRLNQYKVTTFRGAVQPSWRGVNSTFHRADDHRGAAEQHHRVEDRGMQVDR